MLNNLNRLVAQATPNLTLRKDLMQEAMVHLWLTELRRPNQTPSWYLQSCRFHLQHYLGSGRSVDSLKRWRANSEQTDSSPCAEQADSSPWDLIEILFETNGLFDEVSTRDLLRVLPQHLSEPEKAVLHCLAEGLGPREIGRKLRMSHPMAMRHRCRIAEVVRRLERPGIPAVRC